MATVSNDDGLRRVYLVIRTQNRQQSRRLALSSPNRPEGGEAMRILLNDGRYRLIDVGISTQPIGLPYQHGTW